MGHKHFLMVMAMNHFFQQDCHNDDLFKLNELDMNMFLPQQPEIASILPDIVGEPCT